MKMKSHFLDLSKLLCVEKNVVHVNSEKITAVITVIILILSVNLEKPVNFIN